MPNPRYISGYRFEVRVRLHLLERGWLVFRSAGSRSVADLIALRTGEVMLVQCKVSGAWGLLERQNLARVAEEVGARPVLAARDGRHILWAEVDLQGTLTYIEL